jgi:mono/diheme cytochrome c family protein
LVLKKGKNMSMISVTTCFKRVIAFASFMLFGAVAFIYSGLYPMGADTPHFQATTWVLETLREQSIARAASDLVVPEDIETSDRLLAGGADYNEMCSSCHLKPGKESSDFTLGLYPAPPNLALSHAEHPHSDSDEEADKRRFWIIKHGIKASGMPSWAAGHDDERIWNMVAFLKRLPELTPDQYQILTAREKGSAGHH